MSSKEIKRDFSDVNYRFSFSVTIEEKDSEATDVIVVKRDFNIYNFDPESLVSMELKECIDDVVGLIDRDLKSKSRVYLWYNFDENYATPELTERVSDEPKFLFKFTLYDRGKSVITKAWSGDFYPAHVRNNVDLTNKKYKYDNYRGVEMDFSKQIAQRAAADKVDLTTLIMKHISTTCSSYQPRGGKKLVYKQYIPDLKLEDMAISRDGSFKAVRRTINPIKIVSDENGIEKELLDAYSTKYCSGYKEYPMSMSL